MSWGTRQMNSTRVLVTGGAGLLGRALANQADTFGIDLTRMDLICGPGLIQGDVTDSESLDEIMAGKDAVIHAAALHGPHVITRTAQEFLHTNVEGTSNVFEAASRNGVQHVVLMSSTSVYGLSRRSWTGETTFAHESTPTRPTDTNDLCKVLCEQLAEYAARTHGFSVTVLRPGRFHVENIADFYLDMMTGSVDVDDVAQAALRASLQPHTGHRVYCIASRTPFVLSHRKRLSTQADDLIEEILPGAKATAARHGRRLPRRLHRVIDISKACAELNYDPQHNFSDFVDSSDFARPHEIRYTEPVAVFRPREASQ